MEPRLLVEPGVVELAVEERPLEPFHDLELGIEPRFDRITAQNALAERMNRLRTDRVDASELFLTRAAIGVAHPIGHDEQRRFGADRPGDTFVVEMQLELGERGVNAIRDLPGSFLRERHQHDALRRQPFISQNELQHLGHDRGGFPGPRSRFDDEIAPDRRSGRCFERKGVLQRRAHVCVSSMVRGSLVWRAARRSSASCFVRHEWLTGQYLHELKSLSDSFGNAGKAPLEIALTKIASVWRSRPSASPSSKANLSGEVSVRAIGLIVPETAAGGTSKNDATAMA